MAMRLRRTRCLFRPWKSTRRRQPKAKAEAGVTLTELMVAITIMGFAVAGVLAFTQLGAATRKIVDKEVRYSQDLALISDRIVDGVGVGYRGLRQAADVTSESKPDHTRYTFHYSDLESFHQEHYWARDGVLYRSCNTEPAEQMGSVSAIEIDGPDGDMCVLRLISSEPGKDEVEHATSVRLRNYSR